MSKIKMDSTEKSLGRGLVQNLLLAKQTAIMAFKSRLKYTQKEITSQIDYYLVILSSKTHVFEDKMTKYKSSWLTVSFSVQTRLIL